MLSSALLFVGSGFGNDPDIDLLLQNANVTAPSKKRHYALVPQALKALADAVGRRRPT